MGKLVALLGRSASGKDTVLGKLISEMSFKKVLPVTTRPVRPGEVNGLTYEFLSVDEFKKREADGKFIETRSYNTLYNGNPDVWYYATSRDSIDLSCGNYAAIVDLNALDALRREFGQNLLAVYITVPEEIRRARCMSRGDFSHEEWERREADDDKKYTKEILREKIDLTIENLDINVTFEKLKEFLSQNGCI